MALALPADTDTRVLLFTQEAFSTRLSAESTPLVAERQLHLPKSANYIGCGSFRRHETGYLTRLRWARRLSFNGMTVAGGGPA
jgi:hypothetical protein